MEYLYDGVWKKWKSLKNAYVYSQIKSQVVTASVAQDCHPVVIPKPVFTQGIPRELTSSHCCLYLPTC